MKEIIDKLDLAKIKNFSSMKDTAKRMRRKTTDCEKIFAKDTSDFPKYTNNSYNSTIRKQTT